MISLVNEFSVVIDACALIPISLCDLLLRLAEDPAMFKPRWSREILDEVSRTLSGPKFNLSPDKVSYRIACMESAFPEAIIAGHGALAESMPNDPKDRHVLAAAVYGKADAIITLNTRHFPEKVLRDFGIERLTPDQFLVHQWHLDSALVWRRVGEQVIESKKDMATHIELLERMAPEFARLLRAAESSDRRRPF